MKLPVGKRPICGHSARPARFPAPDVHSSALIDQLRRPTSASNGKKWDFPAVPELHVERQVLPGSTISGVGFLYWQVTGGADNYRGTHLGVTFD